MKKLLFLIMICLAFSISFGSLTLLEPIDDTAVGNFPIILKWDYEKEITEEIPVYFSIFFGTSKDNLALYSNNLLLEERGIFFLPKIKTRRVYWKIEAYTQNGYLEESEINSFQFIPNTLIVEENPYINNIRNIEIFLEWENEAIKLRSHLTGSLDNGNSFHLFKQGMESHDGSPWPGYLDLSYSTQTEVTIINKPILDSVYRYSVEDFTNNRKVLPEAIAKSNAVVSVFVNDAPTEKVRVEAPDGKGVFWNVFDIYITEKGEVEFNYLNNFTDDYESVLAPDIEDYVLEDRIENKPTPISTPTSGSDPELTPEPTINIKDYNKTLEGILLSDEEFEKLFAKTGNSASEQSAVKIVIPYGEAFNEKSVVALVDDEQSKSTVEQANRTQIANDVLFILDITGSMSEEIDGIRKSIKEFIAYLNTLGLDIQMSVMPFDDKVPASTMRLNWLDLSGLKETENYLDGLNAHGGDDLPENPYYAITYACDRVNWRKNSNKMILLITDAPAHDPFNRGDAGNKAISFKADAIERIQDDFVLHAIITPGYFDSKDTDFSSYDDPREIAEKTGGILKYADSRGNIDLTKSGILELAENSYYIIFDNPGKVGPEDFNLLLQTAKGKYRVEIKE